MGTRISFPIEGQDKSQARMSSVFLVLLACCCTFVSASSIRKRSADCPDKYSELSSNHTQCREDVGTIVPLNATTKQYILDLHNEYRASVEPPAANMRKLVWSDDLAATAAKWAAQCSMGHDSMSDRAEPDMPGVKIGQNMACGYSSLEVAIDEGWFSENVDFTYGEEPRGVVGHYTQMVNADSEAVGCGQALCPNDPFGVYYVCNYAIIQYSSAYQTPWDEGADGCEACPDACDAADNLCTCDKLCLNGGAIDLNSCTCACGRSWTGDVCQTFVESDCSADHPYCPTFVEVYGPDVCTLYTSVTNYCPAMCSGKTC